MTESTFTIHNMITHETVGIVLMDTQLLHDPEIINPKTLSLNNIKNGNMYTLIPVDSAAVAVLKDLRAAFMKLTTTPCISLHGYFQRVDSLIAAVASLFSQHEFPKVRSSADLDAIINGSKTHEPETVVITIADDWLKEALDIQQLTEMQPNDVE